MRVPCAVWALAALVISVPTGAAAEAPPAVAPDSAVQVFRDPATGLLREPTEAEQVEQAKRRLPELTAPIPPLESFTLPDGGVGMRLSRAQRHHASASRAADGRLSGQCADDLPEAP